MTLRPHDTLAAREVLEGNVTMDWLRSRCTSRQIAFAAVVILHVAGKTDFPQRGLYGYLLGRVCTVPSRYPQSDKFVRIAKLMGLHDSGGRGQHRMKLVECEEITTILNDEQLMWLCKQWCKDLVEEAEHSYYDELQRATEQSNLYMLRIELMEEFNATHDVLRVSGPGLWNVSEVRAAAADLNKLLERPEFSKE